MWLLRSSSISPTKKVTISNPTLWVGQSLPWQLLVKSFGRPWLDIHQRDDRAQMQRAPISTVRGTSLWTGSLVWSFASFNLCFLSLFDWTSSDLDMEVMVGFGCWVPQQDLYLRLEPHGHALFLAAPWSGRVVLLVWPAAWEADLSSVLVRRQESCDVDGSGSSQCILHDLLWWVSPVPNDQTVSYNP